MIIQSFMHQVTHYMPGPFLITMDAAINKTNIVPVQGGFCLSVTYNIFNIYCSFLHQVIKVLTQVLEVLGM